MERRRFLGAATIGGAAALTGCGGAPLGRGLPDAEAFALVARLRRGMQALDAEPFGTLSADRFHRPDLAEHVVRLSLESLLVLDVLRSVPDDTDVPANLAEALAPHLPRLDRSVHTHRALLARMPAEKRRALDARARRDRDVGMDVAEWIDGQASRIGIPTDSRLRVRSSALEVKTRLRRQSTSAVIDDCTARLDAALARHPLPLPAPLARHTDAVVDAIWGRPTRTSRGSAKLDDETRAADLQTLGAHRDELVVPSRYGADFEMTNPTEPVQWNASWARPGDEENRLATIMLSLGLVSCGILLIAGLVVFIAGEVQNGEWDGRTHADDAPTEAQ